MCGSVSVIVIGGVFSFLPFLQFIIHIVIHFIMIVVTFRIVKIITVKYNSLQTHVSIILRLTILLILLLILLLLILTIITFITFITKVVAPVII